MNDTHNRDFLKKAVDIFQGDYATPTKALVWAKTVKEWGGIIFGTVLLTIVILGLIGLFIAGAREQKAPVEQENSIRSADPESLDQQDTLSQQLVPYVKDLLLFTTVITKSINTRQELLDELAALLSSSEDKNQTALEEKVTALAKCSRQCTTERGKFISEVAGTPNPFDSAIYKAVKTFSGFPYRVFNELWEGPPLNPEHEILRWKQLCSFCQQELNKANELLARMVGEAPLEEKTAPPWGSEMGGSYKHKRQRKF